MPSPNPVPCWTADTPLAGQWLAGAIADTIAAVYKHRMDLACANQPDPDVRESGVFELRVIFKMLTGRLPTDSELTRMLVGE